MPYDIEVYQCLFDIFSEIAVEHAKEEAEFSGLSFEDVYDFNDSFSEYAETNPQGSIAIHLAERLAAKGLTISTKVSNTVQAGRMDLESTRKGLTVQTRKRQKIKAIA